MNAADLVLSLSRMLRVPAGDIAKLILTAPYQYKHFKIPKRSGGLRDIYHPTPGLKATQRWLVANVFHRLQLHACVYSYRPHIGIRVHADQHLHSNFLLRLDISNFFPSIDREWIQNFFLSEVADGRLDLEPDAIPNLLKLVCRYSKSDRSHALSIGAPTSPLLSNAILFKFDEYYSTKCAALNCVYTRYADDLYVSTREQGNLAHAEEELRSAMAMLAPRLRINESKRINVSKKARRIVTGLTLTPDRRISVGRETKRSIRTQVFLSTKGKLNAEERAHLCGLVAFVRDVEPAFFSSLVTKYGSEVMQPLLHSRGLTGT
jgi:hypothetical protein